MSKLALITGASSGIGLEMAKLMAYHGHDLILVARTKTTLEEIARGLVKQFGVKVIVHPYDLAQRYSGEALFESLRPYNGEIEYVVNNAGFGSIGLFHKQTLTQINEMIQLNVTSLTELCRLYGDLFAKKHSGKILNVASTAAFQPGPFMAAYYASKAYVLSFSEAIRFELSDFGVQISCLCPGPTYSGFQARSGMSTSRMERMSRLFSSAIMTSEDVAKIAFEGWMKNRSVIIPGPLNIALAFLTKITPRFVTSRIVKGINGYGEPYNASENFSRTDK